MILFQANLLVFMKSFVKLVLSLSHRLWASAVVILTQLKV